MSGPTSTNPYFFSLKSGKLRKDWCSLDQLRNQVEQESRLTYLLHCNERVEVTLGNPAIPDPIDLEVIMPNVTLFVHGYQQGI